MQQRRTIGQKRYYNATNDYWSEATEAPQSKVEVKRPRVEEQPQAPEAAPAVEAPKPEIPASILEAQARLFAQIVPKNKKKKKSKTQKKYEEIQKMLETSNKFFSVIKKPNRQDPVNLEHVLNSTKVLMEPAGICSIDGGTKKYKSWPEYCKTHKFISSLNGSLPDMILPAYFGKHFAEVTDVILNMRKDKQWREKGGMTKMSQVRSVYPVNYDDPDKDAENGEDAEAKNEVDVDMMDQGSGGETMDEDDVGRTQFD